jgi:hypothetical protein
MLLSNDVSNVLFTQIMANSQKSKQAYHVPFGEALFLLQVWSSWKEDFFLFILFKHFWPHPSGLRVLTFPILICCLKNDKNNGMVCLSIRS